MEQRWLVRAGISVLVGVVCALAPLRSTEATGPVPTTRSDLLTVPQELALFVPGPGVLLNDAPATPGGALTAQLVTGPSHGRLTLHPDGGVVYRGDPGFVGDDGFTYVAVDPNGSASAPTAVTITVLPREATRLHVDPALVMLDALSLPLAGSAAARLTTLDGMPATGEVRFTSGGEELCTASVGFSSDGWARCAIPPAALASVLLAGGVTASFAGNSSYLPSSGSAGLIA